MKHPIFMPYGLLLLSLVGVAQYRGWSLNSVNEGKLNPRSVRDNPGVYRSTYAGYHRYSGGK
jgi:hypothetical protein